FSIPSRPGDLFMLCSDGLTSMVEDQVILACIEKNRDDLQATVKALIRAANKGGGEDNITVVFFEIGEDTGEPLEETAQYPVLGEDGEGELDEKTLDELDRVPALDTMVVPPGEAEKVAEPPQPKRRTRSRIVPALLPIAALLTAIGVTEIYRIHPGDAFRQGVWIIIAVAVFAGTLIGLRRDYRRLESYKYLFGLTAIGLLVLPALPGLGTTVNGARL